MSDRQLTISAIIPTYSREEPLRDTLADLIQQKYSNFEILVVDQTVQHQPEIQAYLEQLAAAGKISWWRVPWANLPAARNYAARRAKGDILLFIDDDVRLEPDFLAAHARNYFNRPEIGAVAGRVFDRMKLAESEARSNSNSLVLDREMADLPPEAADPGIAWYYLDLVHTAKAQPVISARGCNMSFRREIFTQYGLQFDERFRGSAVREESDFCLRLRSTNYQIWYDPAAYLIHLGEETGGCHDISTRSLQYQVTFYRNHFLMGLKNLTLSQQLRFYTKLFDCHVLGHPPCYKSGSPIKIITRACFYFLGFSNALFTYWLTPWHDGQIYTQQDRV